MAVFTDACVPPDRRSRRPPHIHRAQHLRPTASARAQYEFWRAAYLFYKKHYAATTPFVLRAAVSLGLALKGGRRLVDEMRRPLPSAPNAAEILP